MVDHIGNLFSEDGFMPHGMCYLWQPGILGLHVTSDALITLAYFSIPFTLLYFVHKRSDLQFNWMFVCFAVFIVACGATHLMEIWTIWHPTYWLSGSIKAITALASVPTAILLVKLIPDALRLPSPGALQHANIRLELEVAERKRAENAVRRVNEDLELRVAERTAQLEEATRNLLREVDERQRAQQSVMQQERLRSLGQMASGIAHDINNALSPATLYAQSLLERDSGLGAEARKQIIVIQRAIDDVAHTVARMKDFYRPRESQCASDAVDLNSLLKQVIELTHARWSDMPQERGIVIHMQVDLAADLPQITGAQSEIRDALTNLILNAVDAMPEGGTLTVRSRTVSVDRVQLEIADTGIGMDEETRAHCLEPFFTTKGERGTGLGLAMVYGMVERHGADIEIDSEPGRGTSIRLAFAARGIVAPASSHKATPSLRAVQTLRILLVDDDSNVLQSLRSILEQDGHTVVVAEGGQSGIEAFNTAQKTNERFAVVITDLGMPHVDGRKVAVAVKSAAPDVPVILLTGWGHRLQAENDTPAHVDRILSKPPKLTELRAALVELTGRDAS